MRGRGIFNKYVIDGVDYSLQELSLEQLAMVEAVADMGKYNKLRSRILTTYGDGVQCTIRILFPAQEMEV